jgi:hypothetical protein
MRVLATVAVAALAATTVQAGGVALAQPRLVPDGDFYGDRFGNGIVDLYAGTGPAG